MATKPQYQKKKSKNTLWVSLGIRSTPEENDLIKAAAAITRQSRCQFVLQASLERAAIYLQPKQEK
jgi:uncharacterized protein (DUF1778 family)